MTTTDAAAEARTAADVHEVPDAAALAEVLIGKVRNILDATVEISRHPSLPLALAQIRGTVVGEDPAEFWRENLDLALVVSQIVPRQCFVYYARTEPNPREGFVVAQRSLHLQCTRRIVSGR